MCYTLLVYIVFIPLDLNVVLVILANALVITWQLTCIYVFICLFVCLI